MKWNSKFSLGQIISHIILLSLSFLIVYPIVWMAAAAFKPSIEVLSLPPKLLPKTATMANFIAVFDENFGTYILNSVWVSLIRTAIPLYTSAIVGYVFGKFDFKGKKELFIVFISTMMIPWIVTIIPQYNIISKLRLIDTYSALIIPFMVSAYGIFLVRSFMTGIPTALIEAGRIDGCGEFRIFHKLILPLTGPPISALGIILFLAAWDDYLWPFLIITNQSKYTLPIGLAKFAFTQFFTEYGAVMAGSLISILPLMMVYLVLQKYIIRGISLSGLKG